MEHVEFCSKNKFEKLVHLVGFIIRIYHDARSSECQIHEGLPRSGGGSRFVMWTKILINSVFPASQ